jgi:glycosyltransferase involved in cell wall biosynthesis
MNSGTEIAHFIAYTGTAMGGPVRAMAAYVDFLARQGCPVTVYSPWQKADGASVRLHDGVRLARSSIPGSGPLRRDGSLWRLARKAPIGLIHSHGLWTDITRLAGHLARGRAIPHLLAPCGMLAPGALRRHQWRKLGVLLWFQKRALREARCLHAKSTREYEDFRRFGLRNPIAVVANPIAPPRPEDRMSASAFRQTQQIPDQAKVLLFLGRLHPVKGLPRLLQAWSRQTDAHPDWVLVLAGHDEAGHGRELQALAAELRGRDKIRFTGELDEAQKWGALDAAALLVLPSDFENFGNSIVEAMSSGVPVITTTGTPWKDLPAAGAGWCVEPEEEALSGALREAFALSDGQRREMGRRAAGVARRFSPEQATADLLAVYQWMQGCGTKPDCVREN